MLLDRQETSQQVITLANVHLYLCHHMASLGQKELMI